ncbi:MAG: hypothetical protein EA369_07430 [Bradymonadales bacterium]|nr:MAG: hypothetical protein EA369_07430 [Bradymonadales bacterium]
MRFFLKKQFSLRDFTQKLRSEWIKRAEKATTAFQKALVPAEKESDELPWVEQTACIGFVEDLAEQQIYGLQFGLNELGTSKIQLSKEGAKCLEASKAQEIYHGDVFETAGKAYRLSLLSLRSMGRYFSLLLLVLGPSLFPLMAQESAIEVTARKAFSIDFHLSGTRQIDSKDIRMNVFGDSEISTLNRVSSRLQPEDLHVFVDASGLCLQRGMEGVINQGLSDLLSKLSSQSRVSISEFYQDSDGTEVYRRRIDEQRPAQIAERRSLINCQEDRRSLNALSVFQRLGDSELGGSFLLISSGNIRAIEGIQSRLAEAGTKLVVALYSPELTPYANEVLSPLTEARGGHHFIWARDSVLDLSQNYPFFWRFRFSNQLPVSWDSKAYSYEILMGEDPLMTGSLNYKRSPIRAFFFWLGLAALIVLALALVSLAVWSVVKFYRRPLCSETGQVMSRSWRGSLFAALGKRPVLIVFKRGEYHRSLVLKNYKTQVGRGLGSPLKLKYRGSDSGLLFTEVAERCFEVDSMSANALILNGMRQKGPLALRQGDRIQWGPYEIHFCFGSSQEMAKEAA